MSRKRKPWTQELLVNWFLQNRPNWILDIESLPDNITAYTKVNYLCKICGYKSCQTITNIVNKSSGCVRCAGCEPWCRDRLIKWFLVNRIIAELDVSTLPDIIFHNTVVNYTCLNCGYYNSQSINAIISAGNGCVRCSGKERWSRSRLISWFKINKPDCLLIIAKLKDNLNSKSEVEYVCLKCNTINKQQITNIVNQDSGCVKCKVYRGPLLVSKILDKLVLDYELEYLSSNLKPKTRYRFDFALIEYKVIIEFHGKQHYEPRDFGAKSRTAEEMHAEVVRNDKAKRKIVKDAGWYHLELHYDLKKTPAEIERLILEAIYYNNF